MSGFLLDTNVVSELRKDGRADKAVCAWFDTTTEDELFLSVLVLGEIRCGAERIRTKDAAQASVLDKWVKGLETAYEDRVLQVTVAIADRWGRLTAPNPISVVDGLLAATALEHDLILVTRNVGDVARTGVQLLNPFETNIPKFKAR